MFTQSLAHWASAYEERINNNYTPEEVIYLRGEAAAAKALGIPWEQRGPKGPMEGGPRAWRGQNYRPNKGVWANRGGKNREFFALKYGGGRNKGSDKGGGTGKGTSKGTDKNDASGAASSRSAPSS